MVVICGCQFPFFCKCVLLDRAHSAEEVSLKGFCQLSWWFFYLLICYGNMGQYFQKTVPIVELFVLFGAS